MSYNKILNFVKSQIPDNSKVLINQE